VVEVDGGRKPPGEYKSGSKAGFRWQHGVSMKGRVQEEDPSSACLVPRVGRTYLPLWFGEGVN
jgi:hypothetical protein